jgi:predicted NAD/FAD-dependent oxidoreductase
MGPHSPVIGRRTFLSTTTAALVACGKPSTPRWTGGWVGDAPARGHRLRNPASLPAPTVQRKASLVIIGAGIGGLAAARAAMRDGIDDIALLDLHDAPGGNSRGHQLAGVPCPLGAHYLPLPGPHAHEVAEWLHEIGVARQASGRTVYDERQLCHSPQERLFFDGAWHDGVLPPAEPGSSTLAQYRRFAARVAAAQRELGFALPTQRAPWTAGHAALDAMTFAQWLANEGLDDARLAWYLDYCCRDDYGAGAGSVSAWAGLHYFASRHGFHAPGDGETEREGVLTWPEGNARLVAHLASPLGARWHAGCVATRVTVDRHAASIDLWNDAAQRSERWSAGQVVLAVPLFVAARTVAGPPEALREAAERLRYAPWLVANLHLVEPLIDRPGAAPSWDNVTYGSTGLGYVNAQHQSLAPVPRATVLTAYRALGSEQRAALLERPWQVWAQAVIDDLAATHPDLPAKLERIDLARHGHAMSIPLPGVRGDGALRALRDGTAPRLHFAHGDLAGYSVFEEAFTAGTAAGRAAARALHRG